VKALLLLIAAAILTTGALHFPPESRRLLFIPTWLIAGSPLAAISRKRTSSIFIGIDSYIAMTCFLSLLILPSLLLDDRISIAPPGWEEAKKPVNNESILFPSRHSISTACRLWNNPRQLIIRHKLPPLTRFAAIRRLAPRIVTVAAILILDHMVVQIVQIHLLGNATIFDFTGDQHPIIRPLYSHFLEWVVGGGPGDYEPISQHQLLMRTFISLGWIWSHFVILSTVHTVFAVFFIIILRFDHPQAWPPLFSSPLDAWSVRRFWGVFWHRTSTPTFSDWTHALVDPMSTVLSPTMVKVCEALGIFLLTGVMYGLAASCTGEALVNLDIWFFYVNFWVVMVEFLIGSLWSRLIWVPRIERAFESRPQVYLVARALGFIWVYLWFFWAVPRWLYPKILCSNFVIVEHASKIGTV
jgi:hypothetical protein